MKIGTPFGRLGFNTMDLARALEKGFVVLALLLYAGAVVPLLHQSGPTRAEGAEDDLLMQGALLCVYGISFCLVAVRWRRFVYVAAGDKLLLSLVGIALISFVWSAAPGVTLQRGVALLGTTLFGAYLATRYTLREQLRLLARALGMAAVLSIAFALALPSYGISGVEAAGYIPDPATVEAWRGAFVTKNVLGRLMVLGVVVFLLLILTRKRLAFAWGGLGLCSGVLLFTNSATALVILLTMLAVLPLYAVLRRRRTLAIPIFVLAVIVGAGIAIWLLSNAESVLDVLGRDVTFTGRTELWEASVHMIQQRALLGYGYGGFWLGWEGKSAYVWLLTQIETPHAHNGFLDLWLDLGLLGSTIFVLGFVATFFRSLKLIRTYRGSEALWPLLYLTFIPLYNLTESALLTRNSIFWVLYVAVVLSVQLSLRSCPSLPVQVSQGASSYSGGVSRRAPAVLPEASGRRG